LKQLHVHPGLYEVLTLAQLFREAQMVQQLGLVCVLLEQKKFRLLLLGRLHDEFCLQHRFQQRLKGLHLILQPTYELEV
jgi:hypothetical protein